MKHARWIGRVGALAVVLGVGAAVAQDPGVAAAAPDTSTSDSATSDNTASNTTTPGPGAASPTARTHVGARPHSVVAAVRDVLTDVVQQADGQRSRLQPVSDTKRGADQKNGIVSARLTDLAPTADRALSGYTRTGVKRPSASAASVDRASASASASPEPDAPGPMAPAAGQAKAVLPAAPTPPAVDSALRSLPSAVQEFTPRLVVSRVLSAVGIGPVSAPNTPAAPAHNLMLWSVAGWLRRQSQLTLDNETPSIGTQESTVAIAAPAQTSGPITLRGLDADSEGDLSYSVVSGTTASGGTVQISGNTLTYTPGADWDGQPYDDTIVVNVSDESGDPHFHGLSGLFHAVSFGLIGESGHESTHTVTMHVVAADDAGRYGWSGLTATTSDHLPISSTITYAGHTLKVFSYNVRWAPNDDKAIWKSRMPGVIENILQSDADIVGLQEVSGSSTSVDMVSDLLNTPVAHNGQQVKLGDVYDARYSANGTALTLTKKSVLTPTGKTYEQLYFTDTDPTRPGAKRYIFMNEYQVLGTAGAPPTTIIYNNIKGGHVNSKSSASDITGEIRALDRGINTGLAQFGKPNAFVLTGGDLNNPFQASYFTGTGLSNISDPNGYKTQVGDAWNAIVTGAGDQAKANAIVANPAGKVDDQFLIKNAPADLKHTATVISVQSEKLWR